MHQNDLFHAVHTETVGVSVVARNGRDEKHAPRNSYVVLLGGERNGEMCSGGAKKNQAN